MLLALLCELAQALVALHKAFDVFVEDARSEEEAVRSARRSLAVGEVVAFVPRRVPPRLRRGFLGEFGRLADLDLEG